MHNESKSISSNALSSKWRHWWLSRCDRVYVLLIFLVIIIGVVIFLPATGQRRYEGKTAKEWLQQLKVDFSSSQALANPDPLLKKITSFGPDIYPDIWDVYTKESATPRRSLQLLFTRIISRDGIMLQHKAQFVLNQAGTNLAVLTPKLIETLENEDSNNLQKFYALRLLYQSNDDFRPIGPVTVKLLGTDNANLVLLFMGKYKAQAELVSPQLTPLLLSPDKLTRIYAAGSIVKLGRGTSAELDVIRKGLIDPDPKVRENAADVIMQCLETLRALDPTFQNFIQTQLLRNPALSNHLRPQVTIIPYIHAHTKTIMVTAQKVSNVTYRIHWRIWLLAFIALLLGIKVVHHGMQPKYQGKTAQEWFDEVSRTSSGDIFLANDPAFKGLQHLGTNAVWFLWHERAQRKSPWLAALNSQLYRWNPSSRNAPTPEQDRAHAAWVILLYFGPETGVLVPEALELLKSNDADEAAQAAMLLGRTKQQANLAVPAILQSIVQTNRNADQRVSHIVGLKEYGPEAKAALPYLRAQLANITVSNSYEGYWLAKAILTIGGPGPEVGYFTKRLVPGNYQQSFPNLSPIEQLGTNARTAAPELHKFLLTLTNEVDSARVLTVIRKIDPEGVYTQP